MYRVEDVKVRNPRNSSLEILALIEKVEAEGWEFVCFSPPMIAHVVPPPFVAVFRKVEQKIEVVSGPLERSVKSVVPESEFAVPKKRKSGRPRKNA